MRLARGYPRWMEALMDHTNELLFWACSAWTRDWQETDNTNKWKPEYLYTCWFLYGETSFPFGFLLLSWVTVWGTLSSQVKHFAVSSSSIFLSMQWLKKDLNCTVIRRRMAEAALSWPCAHYSLLDSIASTDNSLGANLAQSRKEREFNTKETKPKRNKKPPAPGCWWGIDVNQSGMIKAVMEIKIIPGHT